MKFLNPTLFVLLLIVFIAGGMVWSYIFPSHPGSTARTRARTQISSVSMAIQEYSVRIGKFPPNLKAILVPMKNRGIIIDPLYSPSQRYGSISPNNVILDVWGNPIVYSVTDNGTGFRLVSLGEDGKLGTEDDVDRASGRH